MIFSVFPFISCCNECFTSLQFKFLEDKKDTYGCHSIQGNDGFLTKTSFLEVVRYSHVSWKIIDRSSISFVIHKLRIWAKDWGQQRGERSRTNEKYFIKRIVIYTLKMISHFQNFRIFRSLNKAQISKEIFQIFLLFF